MTKVKVISKYLTLKQLLPSKMGKISLMQLSNEEIKTGGVAQKNDLPKSYFQLPLPQVHVWTLEKTIQGKIYHNRCIVKIAKNRSWNKVINQLAANISWDHSWIIQWSLPQNIHFLLHRFSLSQGFDQGGLNTRFMLFLRVNIPSWDALLLCNINSESTRNVDKQCHQVRKR